MIYDYFSYIKNYGGAFFKIYAIMLVLAAIISKPISFFEAITVYAVIAVSFNANIITSELKKTILFGAYNGVLCGFVNLLLALVLGMNIVTTVFTSIFKGIFLLILLLFLLRKVSLNRRRNVILCFVMCIFLSSFGS